MNRRKKFTIWVSGFAVAFTLMLVMLFPVFNGKSGLNVIETLLDDNLNINPVGDDPPLDPDGEAYHYWYAPENSFGISSTKTVNWSYFKQLFLAHTDWMMEYKQYESSDWTEAPPQYWGFERTWNDTGFWKFNLILDVPVDIYSARFTFGIDLPCLQYVERNGYEVWVNYTANATETYSCMFNWSDMANIPGVIFTHGKTDEMFWFRFRRDNIPAGHYEFDPYFGWIASGTDINAYYITGSWAEFSPGYNAYAKSISVRYKTVGVVGNHEFQCALYEYVDYSSSYVGNLHAGTEIKDCYLTNSFQWFTFDFESTVGLTNGTKYYIISNYAGAATQIRIDGASGAGYSIYRNPGVSPLPSPLTGEGASGYKRSIYCNYTRSPTFSNPSPTNNSVDQSLTPKCAITVADPDGDTMDITFASNYSGSWVNYQTNSSVGNGSYSWNASPAFNTELTRYYWKVYCNDATVNISEIYYFTTAANETWQIINNTINGSYSNTTAWKAISITINGTYSNDTIIWTSFSTDINGTYSNSTSWKNIITTINGTYSNTTQWKTIIDTINGTYTNTTTWRPIDTTINGTYSNTSILSWQVIINTINGTYSNTTAWKNIIITINGTYSNTTAWKAISTTINGTYSNSTVFKPFSTDINGTYSNDTITWSTISTTINGTYSNISLPYNITITNEYPTNTSDDVPYNPPLHVTINSSGGLLMNLSFYYGNYSVLMGTNNNITNGTYFNRFINATDNYTMYYWSVRVNDGTNWLNNTFNFRTETDLRVVLYETPAFEIGAFVFSLIGVIVILMLRRKKEVKRNDR